MQSSRSAWYTDLMANKTNLRKLAADTIRNVSASADPFMSVTSDTTNPYAFVVSLKDDVTGESKQFRVVVKPLADKE